MESPLERERPAPQVRTVNREIRVMRRIVQRLVRHPDSHAAMTALKQIDSLVQSALGKELPPMPEREDPRLKQYKKNWSTHEQRNSTDSFE